MSTSNFSSGRLMDLTIDLRDQNFIRQAIQEWPAHEDYHISLDTTMLIFPVRIQRKRITLVLDRHLGPMLTHQSATTLISGVAEQHWRTFTNMRVAHHFLGGSHYVPYVFGQYGFVPMAGPSSTLTGWLGFHHITEVQSFDTEGLIIFDNHLKLILPLSEYFIRQRLNEAANICELQKDYCAVSVEYSGFNKQRPKMENRLAHVLHICPESHLQNPSEYITFMLDAMMVAAVEKYMSDGDSEHAKLTPERIAAEARLFIERNRSRIMPKRRHFGTSS